MRTDKELLQAICEKNQSAYTELYRRYFDDFIRILAFRLGNIDDAKDFSQDFWLTIFTSPNIILTDENGSAAKFLYNLLSFRIIDRLRVVYSKAAIRLEKGQSRISQVCVQEASVEHEIAVKEIEDIIDRVVCKLSELDRQVYHLRRQKYYSVEETANQLSISPKTVRNKLSLILSSVRSELKAMNYSYENQGTLIFVFLTGIWWK